MILAEKITMLRKQNGYSQEEVAERLNVSRQAVSKWESGNTIPDLDKIIKLSELFNVSTDYLLKDDVVEEYEGTAGNTYERMVTVEDANEYMDIRQKNSKVMAISVAGCVFSPIALIVLGALTESSYALDENLAGGIGLAILLVMVGISVFNIILCNLKEKSYEFLDMEDIKLQYGVEGIVNMRRMEFENTYRMCIAGGTLLCILSVIPLLIFARSEDVTLLVCMVGLLLFIVGCGVYLFVYASMIEGSFQKLLQIGDYTIDKKRIEKSFGPLSGAFWCLITAIYLLISFMCDRWELTWIVWPCAALLFVVIRMIFVYRESKKY